MRYTIWFLFVLLSGFNVFSQEKFIQHTVSKGETISQIAQQYNVKSSTIYELNPEAKKGLKFESVLLIPATASNTKSNSKKELPISESVITIKEHLVLPKETLYGITKQYGVTVDGLYALNPSLKKSGLQKGITVKIPMSDSNSKEIVSKEESTNERFTNKVSEVDIPKNNKSVSENRGTEIIREVLPKETKYAIAKEYNISIVDLEKANPILQTEPLKAGQKLTIPVNSAVPVQVVEDNKVIETEIVREVLPKETKYGIAKEFGISVKELEKQNPKIVKKLLVGDKLTIRTSKNNIAEISKKDSSLNVAMGDENKDKNINSFHGADFINQLISTASEYIGVRYRPGGTSKEGFDCSGLICSTFGALGFQLPRSSLEQSQYGVKINSEDAKKGDLIFFKTNGRSQINHVGMVVEVNDGEIKFIHASNSGVIISSVKEKYYSKRFTQINRVL